jgi:hypothetical protein
MDECLKNLRFVLTGSSARKLRGKGVNLLGGRAYLQRMHALCAKELKTWPEAKVKNLASSCQLLKKHKSESL